MTVTAEAGGQALEHVPPGSEGGNGSSLANGKWPPEETGAIPPGTQIPRTPAPSDAATLRKRAQESISKRATGLAAASLASLDALAASTGRSVELAAAGEVEQQPHQMGAHGDGLGLPPLPSGHGDGGGPLYPRLPNTEELETQEGQGFNGSGSSMGTAERSERQEFPMDENDLNHSPDDDDESEEMDVDNDREFSDPDDHAYYPAPNMDRHVTERRSKKSLHFPDRDLGRVDVLREPSQEELGLVAPNPNAAVEAALMENQRALNSQFVIPRDPGGAQRPVPPNVVTTAGRAMAANRERPEERSSAAKRTHSVGDTPGGKTRRGRGPSPPPPPGGGGNDDNRPPRPPPRVNSGGGGAGDPDDDPPRNGGGAKKSRPERDDTFMDQAHRYRKSIPPKLYEIPELSDLSDLNFVSWLQKGNWKLTI